MAIAPSVTMPPSFAEWLASTAKKFLVVGTQKGRDMKQRVYRNSERRIRKVTARRCVLCRSRKNSAARFLLLSIPTAPIPEFTAEERGQAEAIAHNLREMAGLEVPIIATVIGVGGSGGALAIAVADRVLMMENFNLLRDFSGRLRRHHVARCH